MHNTKLMVLLLLTFGQFFIVGLTAFVLWLAGQYGEPPNWKWLRSLRKLRSFGADGGQSPQSIGGSATPVSHRRAPLS